MYLFPDNNIRKEIFIMSQNINPLVSDLIEKAWECIVSLGRAKNTTYMYKCYGISPVMSYFSDRSVTIYTEDEGNNCIWHHFRLYQDGTINKTKYHCIRKTIVIMTSIMNTGDYVWSYEPSILTTTLPDTFSRVLEDYLEYKRAQGFRATTLRGLRPKIKHFLLYVANLGIDDLQKLEIPDINGYIPILAGSYENIGDPLSLLRPFGAYLSENSLCTLNLEALFTIKAPYRKKIHSGFGRDEVAAILDMPDRATGLGKRDYAIIMLAVHTGLRGVDVLTLRFSDIDWQSREIRIVQSKTSKPVTLPVPVAVLNAIAEYILTGRPENTETDIIFLRSRAPHDPMKTWSAHSIIKHNAAKAGIVWQPDERKGFHTIRRTLASRMLASDVPIDTIKEVLGHSSPDSTKPYISSGLSGLKKCPLTLESIPMGREELK